MLYRDNKSDALDPTSSEVAAVRPRRRRSPPPPRDLPTYYYHQHFTEMLEFIGVHYSNVLNDYESCFLADYRDLSFPAQCLYVRLINRRGRLFKRSKLRYPEIPSIDEAIEELERAEFIVAPAPKDALEIFELLTRDQLTSLLRSAGCRVTGTAKKADLTSLAKTHIPPAQLLALLPKGSILVQAKVDAVHFLMFLYFGKTENGLSPFTLRDLGLVKTRNTSGNYQSRFSDPEEARHAWYFASRSEALSANPELADTLYNELDEWPSPETGTAADWRDQFAYQLGRALEYDSERALQVYRHGESSRCSERTVRLLLTSNRKEDARLFLERCIEDPASEEEALFAQDLYERKFGKKSTSRLTDVLRCAAVIDIDDSYRGSPEWAAVKWFRHQGHQAFKVENRLWRTLFGLLFWDKLFGDQSANRHSPFEHLPSDLLQRQFLANNKAAVNERLALLTDRKALKKWLLNISTTHFGSKNSVVCWRQSTLNAVFALVASAPPHALIAILRRLCENYDEARQGYPDLLVIDDQGVRFVEIKSDGDQLRRKQLLRLEQLRRAGFRADLLRVKWVLHPEQAYTVVDVETTGGRGAQHRVTEIGVVKMVNGIVVQEFQTLINPGRHIPSAITHLTGISNAMVADAPTFQDVAEELAALLEGAVFVAHNVDFDYGFISREFERVGYTLAMPKLCTCAAMRKLYPGHSSYGLAALSAAYDIPLTQHHRALNDAQAAASLLMLINKKRQELLGASQGSDLSPADP